MEPRSCLSRCEEYCCCALRCRQRQLHKVARLQNQISPGQATTTSEPRRTRCQAWAWSPTIDLIAGNASAVPAPVQRFAAMVGDNNTIDTLQPRNTSSGCGNDDQTPRPVTAKSLQIAPSLRCWALLAKNPATARRRAGRRISAQLCIIGMPPCRRYSNNQTGWVGERKRRRRTEQQSIPLRMSRSRLGRTGVSVTPALQPACALDLRLDDGRVTRDKPGTMFFVAQNARRFRCLPSMPRR